MSHEYHFNHMQRRLGIDPTEPPLAPLQKFLIDIARAHAPHAPGGRQGGTATVAKALAPPTSQSPRLGHSGGPAGRFDPKTVRKTMGMGPVELAEQVHDLRRRANKLERAFGQPPASRPRLGEELLHQIARRGGIKP